MTFYMLVKRDSLTEFQKAAFGFVYLYRNATLPFARLSVEGKGSNKIVKALGLCDYSSQSTFVIIRPVVKSCASNHQLNKFHFIQSLNEKTSGWI